MKLHLHFLCWLLVSLLLTASVGRAQALYDETLIERTIYVNLSHEAASDTNDGLTQERPMETIQGAISASRDAPTRILVSPGTYRQLLKVQFDPNLLIIEAKQPGTVFVSGADPFTDWVREEDGMYVHSWKVAFGESPSHRLVGLGKRTEMVFVDDQFIPQVASRNEVVQSPGRFAVDEEREEIYLHLPEGVDIEEAEVEVTVRGWPTPLMVVNGKENIVLRGLVFERAAGFVQNGAVTFTNSDQIAIENCDFRFNNAVGLDFGRCNDITVRNCRLNDNGQKGMQAAATQRVLIVDCEVLRNVWRMGGRKMDGWDNGGVKMALWMKDVHFLRCRVADNKSYGVWLDWDQINFRFEDCLFENNERNGVFFEVSPGPFILDNCVLRYNGGGVLSYGAKNIQLLNSWVYHNDGQGDSRGEITLINDGRDPGPRYGDDPYPRNGDWTIRQSIIASSASGSLFSSTNWTPDSQGDRLLRDPVRTFTENLVANNNIWWHPAEQDVFPRPESASIELDFSEWQNQTGEDKNSAWTQPDLSDVPDPRNAEPASPETAPVKPYQGYRYQAESGNFSSGFIHNQTYGYSTGNGALIFGRTKPGDAVSWQVNVPTGGDYLLGLRYSLDGGSPSEPGIKINGELLDGTILPATTFYGNFDTAYFPVLLPAGTSTVELEVNKRTRRPVLDFMEIVANHSLLYPITAEADGIYLSEWLGWVFPFDNIIWHYDLGWIYPVGVGGGVWIYDIQSKQWFFTTTEIYPVMHSRQSNEWIMYVGTFSGIRWFYSYAVMNWVTLD